MRSVATIAIAMILILLQATVLELAPVHIVTPSFGILVVLHAALSPKWSLSGVAVVSFCIGYLFDLLSGAPLGVHAFVFTVMSQFARMLSARLVVRGMFLTATTAFVASLLAGILIIVVRAQVDPGGGYAGLALTPIEGLLTAIFAPPLLWLLSHVEGRLDPARLRVGLARRRRRTLAHATGSRT